MSASQARKLTGTPKLLVEMGPLAAFFVGYFMGGSIGPSLDQAFNTQMFSGEGDGVFVATALFIPAWLIASTYSVWVERKLSPMLILTGILIVGFGSLTLIFQSKVFYYMKSTFVYLFFAGLLGGGALIGRNFLKMMMGEAIVMPDHAWQTLTWRFTGLYVALAIGNEILWRTMTPGCLPDAECAGEAWYVRIETFGFMILIFLFIIAQAPFMMKHGEEVQVTDQSEERNNTLETKLASEPKAETRVKRSSPEGD